MKFQFHSQCIPFRNTSSMTYNVLGTLLSHLSTAYYRKKYIENIVFFFQSNQFITVKIISLVGSKAEMPEELVCL